MKDKSKSAATAADDGAAAPAAAEVVVKPVEPVMPDPVPEPKTNVAGTDEVSEGEILDLRKSALEEADEARDPQAHRFVTLGETVFYGDATGKVWPAMVVHVYDSSVDEGAKDNTITGAAGRPRVDLQVFKRKQICDVENVSFHNFDPPRSLDGWIFRA